MRSSPGQHLLQSRFRPAWAFVAAGLLALLGLGGAHAYHVCRFRYHLRTAEAARQRQDYALEHAHLAACLKDGGTEPDLYLRAARSARHLGAFDEAERCLKRAEDLKGAAADVNLERLLLGVQSENLALDDPIVLDYVHRAPAEQPGLPELLEVIADGFCRRYSLLEARRILDLWAERAPQDVKPLLLRGWIEEQLPGLDGLALRDYARAAELAPNDPTVRLRLAQALAGSHQAAEALPHLEFLARQQPDDPLVLLTLALCRHDLGKTPEAREALERALDPGRLAAVENLASAVRSAKPVPPEVETAAWYQHLMGEANRGERGDPYFVVEVYVRALVERAKLAEDGEGGDEEAFLRQAVKLEPFDYAANYQLVVFLDGRGREEDARPWAARLQRIKDDTDQMYDLTQKIVRYPHDPAPRCQAARIMLRDGQPGQALRWILSVLRENPDHADARRLLAEHEALARTPVGRGKPDRKSPDVGGARPNGGRALK